jgi:hypothetical protein
MSGSVFYFYDTGKPVINVYADMEKVLSRSVQAISKQKE